MWSRRAFLRLSSALGTAALSARPLGLEAVIAATASVADRSPDEAAQDESYWREIQQAFAVDRTLINLNSGNSSSTPRGVEEAFKRYLDFSNQLPVYYRGLIEQNFERVRRQLAEEFGCDAEEMAMTRNATEALQTAQCGLDLRPDDEVVTTDQDYTLMLWAWDQRARRDKIKVTRIQFPVPTTGDDLVTRFERAITPRTRVFHFPHITNTTGQLFPVRDLCRLARQRGILTIVDGAQAAAHFPFSLRELECDVYGTSLHKWLMAPHGTGFLYVRRESIGRLWPLHAELDSLRGDIRKFEEIGTHPAAARAAIADALLFHQAIGADRKAARLRYLTLRWANAGGRANHERELVGRRSDAAPVLRPDTHVVRAGADAAGGKACRRASRGEVRQVCEARRGSCFDHVGRDRIA
jgi:selenocysteine lyase/cysteine desulfurase